MEKEIEKKQMQVISKEILPAGLDTPEVTVSVSVENQEEPKQIQINLESETPISPYALMLILREMADALNSRINEIAAEDAIALDNAPVASV